MRCSEFHTRINEILDQRLDPCSDEVISNHARRCSPCARDLRNYQSIVSVFPPTEPTATIAKKRKTKLGWKLLSAAVIAATLLLTISVILPTQKPNAIAVAWSAKPEQAPASILQASPSLPLFPAKAQVATHSGATSIRMVDTRGDGLGTDFGIYSQPTLLGIHLFASADWTQIAPREMPFGVTVPPVETRWLQVVADEMSPVKESVHSTVELIFRTFGSSTNAMSPLTG